jgi:hypothetical protein
MSFKLPDYQITRLANYPIIQSWLPLPFHSTRSQSSHFGVAFSSCCPSRSRDQPINRSPDFCLRASVVGVCSPDLGDPWRWWVFAFPISAMSCDDVDLGDPCPLPFHSTRSQSSQFGVCFNCCCPSRSRDQPINRSPDFCPGLVIPSAVEGSAFSSAFPMSAMSCDDVDLGDRREKRAYPPPPSIPVIPFWRRLQQLLPFPITRSADQPITRFLSPCLRGWCLLSRSRRCRAMTSISAIGAKSAPTLPRLRSQSSHFGVDFNSCCPSRSRDQPINRSPDSCLRASVVGVCSPDVGDVMRCRRSRRSLPPPFIPPGPSHPILAWVSIAAALPDHAISRSTDHQIPALHLSSREPVTLLSALGAHTFPGCHSERAGAHATEREEPRECKSGPCSFREFSPNKK